MKTAHQWLRELNKDFLQLSSREKQAEKGGACLPLSNSELQRMLEQGAVLVNGEKIGYKELMDFPITSVVLFPNSKEGRITIY